MKSSVETSEKRDIVEKVHCLRCNLLMQQRNKLGRTHKGKSKGRTSNGRPLITWAARRAGRV